MGQTSKQRRCHLHKSLFINILKALSINYNQYLGKEFRHLRKFVCRIFRPIRNASLSHIIEVSVTVLVGKRSSRGEYPFPDLMLIVWIGGRSNFSMLVCFSKYTNFAKNSGKPMLLRTKVTLLRYTHQWSFCTSALYFLYSFVFLLRIRSQALNQSRHWWSPVEASTITKRKVK